MGLFDSTVTQTPSAQSQDENQLAFQGAQGAANQPYTPYSGQMVAPLNSGQQTAIGQLQGSYGLAQPYINTGSRYLSAGAQGLGNVQNYLQAGSQAGSSATNYLQNAQNDYLDAGDMSNRSVQALGAMAPYMTQANGALGQAGNSFAQATGALGQAGSSFGQATGALNQAGAYFGQAAGYADPVAFSGQALQQYMDPYTQSVINTTMAQAAQNNQVQATNLAGNAIGSGAYGGDRNGVAQAALAGQQAMADNSTVAGLNSANYSQALGQFNQEQADRYQSAGIYTGLGQGSISQAAGYNTTGQGYLGQASGYDTTGQGYLGQASGYTGQAQQQGQIAQQYGSLGGLAVSAGSGFNSLGQTAIGQGGLYNSLGTLQGTTGAAQGNLGALSGYLGSTAQGQAISGASAGLQGSTLAQTTQQARDTALQNQFNAQQAYPFQTAGFLANVANGQQAAYGSSTTNQGSPLSAALGLGVLASGASGLLTSAAPSLYGGSTPTLSDARAKENIAPIGKTFDGQNMYRFNYKGEDAGNVRTGLMAQEVAQTNPGAVSQDRSGLMAVNYGQALDRSAGLGRMQGHASGGRVGYANGGGLGDLARYAHGGGISGLAGLGGINVMRPAHPVSIVPHSVKRLMRPRFDNGGLLNFSPDALLGQNNPTAPNPMFGTIKPGAGLASAPQPQTQAPAAGLGVLGPAGLSASANPPPAAPADDPASADTSTGGLGLSKNASLGLVAAGLGMLSGTGSGVQNIGKGGLAGLQTYLGLQQQDRQNALQQQEVGFKKQTLGIDQQRVDQGAQQLAQAAAFHKDDIANQSLQIANQTAKTQADIAATRADTATKMQTITPAGILQRDPNNPMAAPKLIPWDSMSGQGAADGSGSAPAPAAPMPTQAPGAAGSPGAQAAQPMAQAAPSSPYQGITDPPARIPVNPQRINPTYEQDLHKQTGDTLATAKTGADAARNTQMSLAQMQEALNQLPPSGFLAAGPGQQQRAAIAGQANTILRGLGVTDQNLINPNAVASSEELKKLTNRMGFDLAKSLGGREPGFIVQQAVGSVPSSENSPMGAQRLMAGLGATAQRQIDYNSFIQKWAAKTGGDITGADDYFNKANPPAGYATKAIVSTLPPDYVSRLRDAAPNNPAASQFFDQRFGRGTAALVLGQQQ